MSKIEVDAITEQSGSTLTAGGGAGKTVVVDATTVTLGRCGGTVALASGASQTGFGRTGTVDWQTGSIKTGTFTAANGEGYFVDTSGSTSTANLPAGSAGAIVSFSDYTRTFATKNLTINPNGSEKIGGIAQDLILDVNGQALTLVYVDGTEGWINIQNAEDTETGTPPFLNASVSGTGNTLATAPDCANMKIATFTGPGDFTVNSISPTPANNAVAYMIVGAGGGGGGGGCGGDAGGGGGAGGFREGVTQAITPYTASPLVASTTSGITVSAQAYPIQIGGGGPGGSGPGNGTPGNVVSALGLTSAGGGYGQGNTAGSSGSGGSGGGGRGGGGTYPLGAGDTPPTSPPQGNPGGQGGSSTGPNPQSPDNASGGGGGATTSGSGAGPSDDGGNGGAGATTSISGTPTAYAGGGGGSGFPGGSAGTGGAGAGTALPSTATGGNGTDNTGGGAGGGKNGGTGGSGIVVIRYKFQ